VVFLPQDGNFTSMGVIKAPDARPNYLGFEGFFLPTAVVDEQGPRSVFPDALPRAVPDRVDGRAADRDGRPSRSTPSTRTA
jgi:cytochrome c biogenesis protein